MARLPAPVSLLLLLAVVLVVLSAPTFTGATRLSVATETTYGISFHETGLDHQTWSVTLDSVTESTDAQGGWITFREPNGSYNYSISGPAGFNVTPTSGEVAVSGQNPHYIPVTFTGGPTNSTPTTYSVSFQESGLSGQTWAVTIGPLTESTNSQGGWISFHEPNGTYAYTVSAPPGFESAPASGSVSVAGHNPHYVPVDFGPSARYKVSFNETGLSGQNWSITLSTASGTRTTILSANWSIEFQEQNGTYTYVVGVPLGYSASPSSGSVTVAGANSTNISVDFSPSAGPPTPIQHVVLVMMENQNLATVTSYAPYLDYLWNTYGRATQFYPVCHESPPNYASITSGRYYVCGGSIPESPAADLPDVLEQAGLTWAGYFESMPTPCDRSSNQTLYDTAHDPFLISKDIVQNLTRCELHVVNSSAFNESVANGTLPAFSFYIPNTHDDCEDSKLPVCDAWMKGFLAPMINSTDPTVRDLMNHTAFFVAFDEGLTDAGYSVGGIVNGYCENQTGEPLTVCGGHAYLTVVSPSSVGTEYTLNATDYNIESTIEWLLGVGTDGGYDGTANFPAMTGLFE
jgi:Phosphoesterase family